MSRPSSWPSISRAEITSYEARQGTAKAGTDHRAPYRAAQEPLHIAFQSGEDHHDPAQSQGAEALRREADHHGPEGLAAQPASGGARHSGSGSAEKAVRYPGTEVLPAPRRIQPDSQDGL